MLFQFVPLPRVGFCSSSAQNPWLAEKSSATVGPEHQPTGLDHSPAAIAPQNMNHRRDAARHRYKCMRYTRPIFLRAAWKDALVLDTPSSTPIYMEAFSATASENSIRIEITFVPIASKSFPANVYDTTDFPGLSV